MMNNVSGLDWNAVARQYNSVPQAQNFNGSVYSPPVKPDYDVYEKTQKNGGFPVVGTLVALAAATTAVVLARKGKILKSGKWGGKIGDWIRSIGKAKDPKAFTVNNTKNVVNLAGKSISVKPAQNLSYEVAKDIHHTVKPEIIIKGGQSNDVIKLADQKIGEFNLIDNNITASVKGNIEV